MTTGWPIWSDSWVGLTFILAVPPSARADGELSELAEQVDKLVEHFS